MMQTAEVRDELDLAVSSDRSREWSVFTKGQVRAGAVIVVCMALSCMDAPGVAREKLI